MSRARTVLVALAPFALCGLAREVDRALGLVLRSELEPDGLVSEVGRAMAADGPAAIARVALWIAAGAGLWLALAEWRARSEPMPPGEAVEDEARTFAPLYLRPALTLLALASVALRPAYPWAFTLPVALTQDWAVGVDVAVLAALAARRLPAPRVPAPGPGAVFLVSFLAYALLTPEWGWRWEGHPGNEPKYLRQAVALGEGLTFDAEGVSAAMEDLPPVPLADAVPRAAAALGRESWRMAMATARGEAGRDAIRATRITRQTIRGKEGGVYYVLAPGPSLLLAPALRLDRALNLARGTPGRVAVSVLLWCALAALLVAALFLLARHATERPGLAAALAFGFALVPPFVFYSFQFYPEMVGALVLALAFRTLAFGPEGLRKHPWLFGFLLATLPWLHQKFLPVWLVLVATALVVGWRHEAASRSVRLRWAMGLLVPQLASVYLTALYNFAITGSVRPDALFLAWGPGGVTTARVGQGILGLLLDARYGILPYVPVLMLAAAGLVLGGARRFAVVLPAAAVYYLTVASADNWAGAVCNLGRYFMPIAPLAAVLAGIALARVGERRGAIALALMLAAWSGLFALALWRDPIAANDSALLLAKSPYGDGNRYIPNLFIRHWSDGAPGLSARIGAWLAALVLIAYWLRRAAAVPDATPPTGKGGEPRVTLSVPSRRTSGASPAAVLASVTAVVLALGLFLESWPGRRAAPVFTDALGVGVAAATDAKAADGSVVFLTGAARVREDEAVLGPGAIDVVVRAPVAVASLRATVGGEGALRAPGLPPIVLRPTGGLVDLPLVAYHEVRGRDGRVAVFTRTTLSVDGQAVLRLGAAPLLPPPVTGPAPDEPEPAERMEPGGAPLR